MIISLESVSLAVEGARIASAPGQQTGPPPVMLASAESCHCYGPGMLGSAKHKGAPCCLL